MRISYRQLIAAILTLEFLALGAEQGPSNKYGIDNETDQQSEEAARKGSTEHMRIVADTIFGNRIEARYPEGIELYRNLFLRGGAEGATELGRLYSVGQGVPEDHAEAVGWFKKAALHRSYIGSGYLGIAYAKGDGVEQDYKEAVRLLKFSADCNFGPALRTLGELYVKGLGVEKDVQRGEDLIKRSQVQIESDLSIQRLDERQHQAYKPFLADAERGDAEAQFRLGVVDYPHNRTRARAWFEKAAAQGHAEATRYLGEFTKLEATSPKDHTEAFNQLFRAAEGGSAKACTELGKLYLAGSGVTKNYSEAIKCFTKGSRYGDSESDFMLGQMAGRGQGMKRDLTIARKWFEQARQGGFSRANDALIQLPYFTRIPDEPDGTGVVTPPAVLFPMVAPIPDKLLLRGILGTGSRRLALINSQPFAAGETATVRVKNAARKVKCLEIRTNSVIISVDENAQNEELFLTMQNAGGEK